MKHTLLLTSLLSLVLAGVSLHADTLYWSGNGTTLGGAGTWNTTAAHWGTSTSGPFTTVWNNANSDSATLSAGAGATGGGIVTLGGAITMNGTLTWQQTPGTYASYSINGASTLTFSPGSTISCDNSLGGSIGVGMFNCPYAGTITKVGAAQVEFNNASGNVTKFILNAGTASFAAPSRFGSGADVADFITFAGGSMRPNTTTAWTMGKSITVNSGNGTINGSSASIIVTQDKPITWNSSAYLRLYTCQYHLASTTSSGTGTLSLYSAQGTYCDAANVIPSTVVVAFGANCTLYLSSHAQTISSLAATTSYPTATVNLGNATLTLSNGRHTYAGIISGTGGLVKQGTSPEILSGNNTYSGATTVSAGTLTFGGASTCTGVTTVNSGGTLQIATSGTAFPSSPIVLAGGALDVNNLSVTIAALSGSGNISNNLGQTLTVNGDLTTGGTFQDYSCYSGALTNGSLYKSGTHAMALRGSNTFDGTLTFDNGTLSVGAAPDRLPIGTVLNFNSPALFQLDANSQTVNSLAGSGSINLGGGTLIVNPGASTAFSGVIQNSELAGSSTALGHGLRGYYYDNIDMTSLRGVTDNAPVNLTWGPPNGYALACNGTSTGYGALVTPSDSVTGTFTVECWAYPSNTTANMSMIGTRRPTDFGFDMKFMGGKPVIHGDIGSGTAWIGTTADASFTFTSNTWYHIAYVVTPTSCTIYANGTQIGTTNYASSTPVLYDANHKIYIGQYGAGEYFNGQLGEVRIWNTARTVTEIQTCMNQRLLGTETGLAGYWRCDDGSGTTLTATVGVNGALAASTGWAASGPVGTTAYYHSARWLGQVLTTAAGTYTFTTTTGDSTRLWVNGTLVIDGWVGQSATARSGTIALAANTRYDIVMEGFNGIGGAAASLSWMPPGDTTTNVIPSQYLFLPGAGQLVKAGSGTQILGTANTYTGGTTVTGAGSVLEAQVDGALGGGNVVVADATLTLDSSATISTNADVLLSGSTSPLVNLNFSGINNIHALSFDGGATYLPAGTYGTTAAGANHPDDIRFASSTGAGLLNVTAGPSTITLASSGSPAVYGSPVNLTATVTSGVTGTVTFFDGANFLGTATLSGSPVATATLSVSNLQVTVSPHAITAVYSGDATHSPRTSSAVSITTTAAPLTPNVVVANKAYDGTTNASISSATTFNGIFSGDTNYVHIDGSAVAGFLDKNVGVGKTVNITGMALSGSLAANYSMAATTASVTANITAKALTVTNLAGVNRVYDGTTNATFTGTPGLSGVISPDVVTLGGAPVASFATRTIGTNKVVTVNGYTLGGADAANYSLTAPTVTANISQSPISVSGLSVVTKTYDGTNSATLSGTAALSPAPFLSDVVTLGGTPIASFNNKNAGSGKAVTVTGYTISGTDATNYNLSQPGLTGTINTVPTTCVLVSSVNPSTNGQNVTFTATITASPLPVVNDAPTSTASFTVNTIPVSSPTVVSNAPGVATVSWSSTSLALGTNAVLAAYLGDGNYQASNNSVQQVVKNPISATAVTITNIAGTTLKYDGGSGAKFILVQSPTANASMNTWTYPGLTNTATPGSFTIPPVGTGAPRFYRVLSQ